MRFLPLSRRDVDGLWESRRTHMWSFKRPLWNTYCVPGPGDTAVHRAPQISAPSFQTRFSNNFQTREINQTWLCQRRQQGSKGTAGFTDPSELSESSHAVPSIPHLAFLAVFSVPPSPTITWSHQWPPLCLASTRAHIVPSTRVLVCAAGLCSLAGAPCGWTSS